MVLQRQKAEIHGRRKQFRLCPCMREHRPRMTNHLARADLCLMLDGRLSVPRFRNFSDWWSCVWTKRHCTPPTKWSLAYCIARNFCQEFNSVAFAYLPTFWKLKSGHLRSDVTLWLRLQWSRSDDCEAEAVAFLGGPWACSPGKFWKSKLSNTHFLCFGFYTFTARKIGLDIIGSAEALPILCVRYIRWEREREREREIQRERYTERERERRKWRHHCRAKIGDEFCTSPCQKCAP